MSSPGIPSPAMSSPAPAYTPHGAFTEDWSSTMPYDMPSSQKKNGPTSPLYDHPDIQSPGLESVWGDDQGKEVVPPQPQPEQQQQPYNPHGHYQHQDGMYPVEEEKIRPSRICGLSKTLFFALLVIFVIVLVALGVGLGVGLGTKKSHHSTPSYGNSVNPAYLSKSGAFNGSGVAIASYSFGNTNYGIINVYFQHWDGQLRKMQLMADGTWQGGDSTNIVATDARNGTPISAVAYAMDQKSTWHIFYIDTQDTIREKIMDNSTNLWRDGPIGDLGLKAMNDSSVGLQACWYGSFYGDANYVHSPIPGTGSNTTSPDSVVGMHLWYGREPTVLEEVTWTYNTSNWYRQDNFSANGHAGIGCYSWGPGSVSYVMMVNFDDAVQVLWKDLNSTVTSTSAHPVNKWVNSTVTIPNVMQNTSLGYTNYLYAQNQDRTIGGYNISWNAENTKLNAGDSFTIPNPGLAGTHFSVSALPRKSGGDDLVVFNQQNGSDITENVRDLNSGQWTYANLQIPQS